LFRPQKDQISVSEGDPFFVWFFPLMILMVFLNLSVYPVDRAIFTMSPPPQDDSFLKRFPPCAILPTLSFPQVLLSFRLIFSPNAPDLPFAVSRNVRNAPANRRGFGRNRLVRHGVSARSPRFLRRGRGFPFLAPTMFPGALRSQILVLPSAFKCFGWSHFLPALSLVASQMGSRALWLEAPSRFALYTDHASFFSFDIIFTS